MESEAELPKAHIRRIVKNRLSELIGPGDGKKQLSLNKDALLAISESARIFIHYVTTSANENCRENKRQTVGADDVLRALDDLDFGEFVPPLKEALEEFRTDAKNKNKMKTEMLKKRKEMLSTSPLPATDPKTDKKEENPQDPPLDETASDAKRQKPDDHNEDNTNTVNTDQNVAESGEKNTEVDGGNAHNEANQGGDEMELDAEKKAEDIVVEDGNEKE